MCCPALPRGAPGTELPSPFLCPQDPVLHALLAADLEGFQHFLSWEEAGEAAMRCSYGSQGAGGVRLSPGLTLLFPLPHSARCSEAELGVSRTAYIDSTDESSLLPAGLIQ